VYAAWLGVCAVLVPVVAGAQDDAASLIRQARALSIASDQEAAIPIFERALTLAPDDFGGHLGIGIALDEDGDYARAQQHLQRAIELAPDEARDRAITAMAVSYAFDGRPAESARYYQQLRDRQLAARNPFGAAETANSLARVYLESGDPDAAERWYRVGYDAVMALPDLRPEQQELAELRWLFAASRIEARRGQFDLARQHVDALRTIFAAMPETAINADQRVFLPYAVGYVELAAGSADGAIAELRQSDQDDPFVLMLIAQAYELKDDAARARDYYGRILGVYAHNVGAAVARPLARRKLASQ
jgi:tetratricopeptide (TPR) repeat protein